MSPCNARTVGAALAVGGVGSFELLPGSWILDEVGAVQGLVEAGDLLGKPASCSCCCWIAARPG